jgi:hypothetical protein
MFLKLFGLVSPERRPRRAFPTTYVRPRLEALEPRYAPSCTSNVINRVLTVQCDGNPNTVTADVVTNELGQFTVINGQSFYTSTHDSIVIYGGSGGLTTNILAVVRPLFLYGHHDYDAVNIGDLTHPLQRIQSALDIENPPYYNVVTIDDRGDGASRTGAINVVNIEGSPYEQVTVPGAAAMSFKVADTRAVTLRTGTGGSVIDVLATAAFYGGDGTTVEGHSFHPTVNVGNNDTLQDIRGPLTITEGLDGTRVNINDGFDNASHSNGVTLTASGLTGLSQGAIGFGPHALLSLTITAGNGNNPYTIMSTQDFTVVSANPVLTTLNTGSGTDTVNVQGASGHLVVNGGGADTIALGDTSNTLAGITGWVTVSATPTDTLVLNDQGTPVAPPRTYTVTPTSVHWTGGPPVTYSGLGALAVNGSGGTDTYNLSGGTSATAAVSVNGGGGANTLLGSNAGNLWAITGADTGSLSGTAYPTSVTFSQVGNLHAGTGGDTFQFADGATLSGRLIGGGGDTLDDRAYSTTVIVDLQRGVATGVGAGPAGPAGAVSGIGTVYGGIGGGSWGAYNLLIGGPTGGNTLYGGTGRRNILVAGGGSSTLNGGDQDDLLIAGTTNYDNQTGLVWWLQIGAYWAGTDPFLTRKDHLLTGNGVAPMNGNTVTGNGGGNTLNGNNELALIYTDGLDNVGPPPGPPPGFDPNSWMVLINP